MKFKVLKICVISLIIVLILLPIVYAGISVYIDLNIETQTELYETVDNFQNYLKEDLFLT